MPYDLQALDDEIRAYIARCEALDPADQPLAGPEEQRRRYRALCRAFDAPRPEGLTVTDTDVEAATHRIPIRIYRPEKRVRSFCLVFFHGGGWVVGDLETHDSIIAELAAAAGVTAVAVDYRLAPEHRYPAAIDDGWSVIDWLVRGRGGVGLTPWTIALAGDSAGATIAAALALKARDRGYPPLAGQLLVYPAFGGDLTLPSYAERAEAPLLTTSDVKAYWQLYCESRSSDGAYAMPLKAFSFNALPPSFVIACEHDPLRDDALEYADRLTVAGVAVELRRERGLIHGFLRARHSSRQAAAAFGAMVRAVQRFAGS